jgi:hypothetical protein
MQAHHLIVSAPGRNASLITMRLPHMSGSRFLGDA